MPHELPASHCATVLCQVPAPQALAFLADGLQLGRWALGCWDTTPAGEGMVRGHSLFDDQPSWVRPVMDRERLAVVYHVGGAPDALRPRIRAVVEPVEAAGQQPCCRISLHAERAPGMDDARWLRLMRCHEVEVLLIQARLALPPHSPVP
ncbi:hypothetical protein [Variovorax guangxiensis]|uniref:hypothetical protein n=1 Tax=Variovorax guangxiensis TaxID=1775474 RepID=UPI002854EA84|nr:hypothetical protein [Variovorax guangxiensis]MDR6856503.1 hypothetical protein [Variovorax guangxiensis]